VSLQLLAEVINSRLFTTVRDSLGLTYDVSFEVRKPGAGFVLHTLLHVLWLFGVMAWGSGV
jgi:predicted Zn-dependent peptidase